MVCLDDPQGCGTIGTRGCDTIIPEGIALLE